MKNERKMLDSDRKQEYYTDKIDCIFLQAVANGLERRRIEDPGLSTEEWKELMRRSVKQSLLPVVFEAVYPCLPEEVERDYRAASLEWISRQVRRTEDFLQLYRQLSACGIEPLVFKGIVCRDAYTLPDWRVSSDEDVYIPHEKYAEFHKKMLLLGFRGTDPNFHSEHETLYVCKDLRIEGHWEFFPRENDFWNRVNALTADFAGRAEYLEIEGTKLLTLEPTDHMIFLILHAMKHFILSGVGIRQICDIVHWDRKYRINWERIRQIMSDLGGARFTAALLDAGHRLFGMPIPEGWIPADSTNLIRDALEGGVFGHSTEDRLHSSSITSSYGSGLNGASNFLSTVFPPREVMEINYPWVSRSRMFLPLGWTVRLLQYAGKIGDRVSPIRSIQIGKKRMKLIDEYEIFRPEKKSLS